MLDITEQTQTSLQRPRRLACGIRVYDPVGYAAEARGWGWVFRGGGNRDTRSHLLASDFWPEFTVCPMQGNFPRS